MPHKICGDCEKKHGVRKHRCECGYTFPAKGGTSSKLSNKHPLYPEPGRWTMESTKGLPSIEPPDELPDGRKLTNGECEDYIAYEGIGTCLWDYIDSRRIEDPKLAELWQNARNSLREIVIYLEGAEARTD